MSDRKDFILVEKYRPQKISDIVLPKSLRKTFSGIVKDGNMPNMIFAGVAGVGKTTVAKALCNELDMDYIIVNGSMDGNIDTLRGKISKFASTVSLQGGTKVVILDEGDYLNPQSTQPALRNFIEEFHNNCRFIITCNYRERIIKELHSRCSVYDFAIPDEEKSSTAAEFFSRAEYILEEENVSYDKKALAGLIKAHYPDFRRVLNEIDRYAIGGTLDSGILADIKKANIQSVLEFIKNKKFKEMRKWVADNRDVDSTALFNSLYLEIDSVAPAKAIPQAILIIGEYLYKDAFVANREINTAACLTELMYTLEW